MKGGEIIKIKKLSALILVFVMVILVFASKNEPGPPYDDLDGKTITVWSLDCEITLRALADAAAIYQRINPDFVLRSVEMSQEEISMQITAAAASGTFELLPDIILMRDQIFHSKVTNYPEVFFNLTDSGINFDDFAPAKASLSVVESRNFGVPFDNDAVVMGLRTDIVGAMGFTVDDFTGITWGRFIELGQIALFETGMPMVAAIAGGADWIDYMARSAGVSMFNIYGNPNIVGNAVLRQIVETYTELVKTGVLVEVSNRGAQIGSFVNDVVVGAIGGYWILDSIRQNPAHERLWAITNIPRLDVPGGTNSSGSGGSSWAVTSNANASLAIDFLKNTFAGSAELYATLLQSDGVISAWLPAAESPAYQEMQVFFGRQRIFEDIIRFSINIPAFRYGEFHHEVISAIEIVVSNVLRGADIDAELQAAQEFVELQMQG